MIPDNRLVADFFYYPKQQQCAVDILGNYCACVQRWWVFKCTYFSFNLCINCRNVTKFYKNFRYFATTVPLSQTATARSPEPGAFSPAPATAKKSGSGRLHNTDGIRIILLGPNSDPFKKKN